MRIELKQIDSQSISVDIPKDSTSRDLKVWRKLIADILLFGYLNKPTCLITIDPDKKSVGNEFGEREKVKQGKHPYLVTRVLQFEAPDLLEVSESSDLQLGLLVISPLSQKNLTEFNLESLFPTTEDGVLAIKESVMFCAEDGYCLYWLNFNLPTEEVKQRIKSIAEFCGIEVNTLYSVNS